MPPKKHLCNSDTYTSSGIGRCGRPDGAPLPALRPARPAPPMAFQHASTLSQHPRRIHFFTLHFPAHTTGTSAAKHQQEQRCFESSMSNLLPPDSSAIPPLGRHVAMAYQTWVLAGSRGNQHCEHFQVLIAPNC